MVGEFIAPKISKKLYIIKLQSMLIEVDIELSCLTH
ncbi:MAG: hypothetical protein RIT27_311 [Pseudomonadota bacterium]|jgi:hypothetical protein